MISAPQSIKPSLPEVSQYLQNYRYHFSQTCRIMSHIFSYMGRIIGHIASNTDGAMAEVDPRGPRGHGPPKRQWSLQ